MFLLLLLLLLRRPRRPLLLPHLSRYAVLVFAQAPFPLLQSLQQWLQQTRPIYCTKGGKGGEGNIYIFHRNNKRVIRKKIYEEILTNLGINYSGYPYLILGCKNSLIPFLQIAFNKSTNFTLGEGHVNVSISLKTINISRSHVWHPVVDRIYCQERVCRLGVL